MNPENNNNDHPQPAPVQIGVPRQFGIGPIMVVMALYAVLFAFLKTAQVGPVTFVVVAIFPALIAISQTIFFGGKRPREASILTGAALAMMGTTAAVAVMLMLVHGGGNLGTIVLIVLAPAFGAVAGYFFGCTVGGVFLVGRWLDERARRGKE